MRGACQLKLSRRHFTDDRALPVSAPGNPLPHFGKRPLILILVDFQQRDDAPSLSVELVQELGCHAFSIYHEPVQVCDVRRLFVAMHQLRGTNRQMLIASMGGGQERMTIIIMQHDSFSTPQDFPAQLAHRSPGN